MSTISHEPPHETPRFGDPAWRLLIWLGAAAVLWVGYSLVFVGTVQTPLAPAMAQALANVAPLVLLAAGLQGLLRRRVRRWRTSAQVVAHLALAPAFALVWYGATMLLLAVAASLSGRGFHITGFAGPALTWQIFQGLILYCAAAAVAYALPPRGQTADGRADATSATPPLERYLIRDGEDFRPVEVADIVTITGAQDYSEVSTASGRHLVRMSLAQFEARLDPGRFVRVHRSTIIHLARLERAELAGGGRMLAHMIDGQRVPVSRSGVKALRPLIV